MGMPVIPGADRSKKTAKHLSIAICWFLFKLYFCLVLHCYQLDLVFVFENCQFLFILSLPECFILCKHPEPAGSLSSLLTLLRKLPVGQRLYFLFSSGCFFSATLQTLGKCCRINPLPWLYITLENKWRIWIKKCLLNRKKVDGPGFNKHLAIDFCTFYLAHCNQRALLTGHFPWPCQPHANRPAGSAQSCYMLL